MREEYDSLAAVLVNKLLEQQYLLLKAERKNATLFDEKQAWRLRAEEAERKLRGAKTSAEVLEESFNDAIKEVT